MFFFFLLYFFFQAEDGIRYLVRSRGLGDVYKRQESTNNFCSISTLFVGMDDSLTSIFMVYSPELSLNLFTPKKSTIVSYTTPVSYTHLTLPTSDLV